MANRKRDIQLHFMVSQQEKAHIQHKMEQLGTENMGAYIRKMALDGYVLRLDLPELRELVTLLRRCSNNINQIAKRMNETGRIYDVDIADIAERQNELWAGVREVIHRLGELS